ncbi:MAG: diacylglycerol kinase family protein [Bacteroidota bacterium]
METFWYIIANPVSGGGAVEKQWPVIERLLQEMSISYTIRFTERRGHATLLAEEAVLRGQRRILGIGGDGTNHEIVNGIMQQQAVPPTEIMYALLPIGTGNDWARTYTLPSDPKLRLQRLLEEKTVLQDIGLVQYQTEAGETAQRYFANVAGMAYDAYLCKIMQARSTPVQSQLIYLALITQYIFKYNLTEAKIRYEDAEVQDFFYTINIGICRYSGGGMQLVPQAIPDDGMLALTYARRIPKMEVLLQTPRFYNGTLLSHSKVTGTTVKSLQVDHVGETPTLVEADGEFLGQTPATFSVLEKALKVVL